MDSGNLHAPSHAIPYDNTYNMDIQVVPRPKKCPPTRGGSMLPVMLVTKVPCKPSSCQRRTL